MSLSTHVLDTASGRPAAGLDLVLERQDASGWTTLVRATTDDDGRVAGLGAGDVSTAGIYRLTFATGAWHAARGARCFYPEVAVLFEITAPEEHHHVPLLLSPFGYSTYRGS